MIKYLVNKYWELRMQDRKLFFDNIDSPDVVVKDIVKFIQVKHVQVAVAKKDDKTIIFFIGSNQLMDWIYNLLFRFKIIPYEETGTNPKVKAHVGFYKSYLLVRKEIHKIVKDLDEVLIMGQSMGAAVATFASLDIKYNFPDIKIECVTTGSPRCGNRYFKDSYNKRVPNTTRYAYGNDLIAAIPFILFGYRHIGNLIHLGPKRWHNLSIKDHLYAIKKKTIPNSYLKELG